MANNTRGQTPIDNWDYNAAPSRSLGINLNSSEYQNVSSSDVAGAFPPLKLGTVFNTYDGRIFKFCESAGSASFNTALAEGDLVVPMASFALTAVAVSSTDSTIITATSTSQVYANQFRGGYLFLTSQTGKGQTRRVVANTAAAASGTVTISLERAFTTAPASSPAGLLWHPYRVIQMPASAVAGDAITGISYGTVTAPVSATPLYKGGTSYYGWVQTGGFCEYVKFTGNVTAAAAAQPIYLVPSTTAGTAIQGVATLAQANPFGVVSSIEATGGLTAPTGVAAYLWHCQG